MPLTQPLGVGRRQRREKPTCREQGRFHGTLYGVSSTGSLFSLHLKQIRQARMSQGPHALLFHRCRNDQPSPRVFESSRGVKASAVVSLWFVSEATSCWDLSSGVSVLLAFFTRAFWWDTSNAGSRRSWTEFHLGTLAVVSPFGLCVCAPDLTPWRGCPSVQEGPSTCNSSQGALEVRSANLRVWCRLRAMTQAAGYDVLPQFVYNTSSSDAATSQEVAVKVSECTLQT